MTDSSAAIAHFAADDFRLSSIISRSGGVLSRHLPTFFIVALIACSPMLLLGSMQGTEPIQPAEALRQGLWAMLGGVLMMVLSTLGYAILLYVALQDIRRGPVRLTDALHVALRRFFPPIGLFLVASLLVVLGLILLIIPGLVLYTMWLVATPACVAERRGPWMSLRRSRELTKGYRWKLFAFAFLILVGSFASSLVGYGLRAFAGPMVGLGGQWIWTAIWTVLSNIVIAVAYHDLRVIKERVDIMPVFD